MSQSIQAIINDCKNFERNGQEKLYHMFYGYAMSICLPYTNSEDEAQEVVNDGFLKVFRNFQSYNLDQPFKGWLRRILINTAIDNFRQNKKHYYHKDIEDNVLSDEFDENIIDKLSADEILSHVQKLPPAYRMVFNLYVLDGYKHHEIAKQLQISEGTSKSNLSKARNKLKVALLSVNTKAN